MTDVFISYASGDRDRAREIANVLSARGLSVWWDRNIKAGQAFDEVIERELETATSVVVLWSEGSIASEWVKNEAAVAAQRRVLVPVLLDNVKVPLEFRRRQTADLIGWDGDPSHPGLQALIEVLESSRGEDSSPPASATPPVRSGRGLLPWIAAGAAGFALGCVVTYVVVGASGRSSGTSAARINEPAARSGGGPPSVAGTGGPAQRASTGQAAKGALPINLGTRENGVYVDIVGFEKSGELTSVEWVIRNTSDQRITVCSHASQASLIDQNSGESWRALHSGGPAAGCQTVSGGTQSGAWVKFKLGSFENRRFSVSLPILLAAPELPMPRVASN